MPDITMKVYDREVVGVQNRYDDVMMGRDMLCENDEMHFSDGKIYGIWSHCGGGGQAVAQLLTGKTPIIREDISVDGVRYNEKKKIEIGWMMGEGIEDGIVQMSVKDQIMQGLKKADLPFYWMDVVKKFDLTEDNLKKKLNKVGHERWRASAAIGYAHGMRLYVFPWVNYATLKESIIMGAGFGFFAKALRDIGATVIVPSDSRQILTYITDEIIDLKNPRFGDWDMLYEYMRNNDFLGKFDDDF
ncbi:MAG: hypothetical protein J1F64_04595 [Oscillospiraceae bacterium]|nr:hypothetical protein [Oscillospiraceae bacterium]